MGYVCTIAGGKGGVGKTTTAINLATAAADGRDVVLLDADLGMANVGAMLGLEPSTTLHDVLADEATLEDALVDDAAGPAVVVGRQDLEAYAEADPAGLRDVVADLRAAADLVVIDTGAGLSHDGLLPLGLADGILLVTTPDDVAVRNTAKTAALAARVDGSVIGVVVTRATADTDVDAIAEALGQPVVGVVPDDPGVADRPPIVRRSPDAPAADAYRRLAAGIERVAVEGATGEELADTWTVPDAALAETDGDGDPGADAADAVGADADGDAGPVAGATSDGEAADADDEASAESAEADDRDADSGGVFGLFR